jgi:hypothetical protein
MGNGLYGELQGNETRAAGRHNAVAMTQEAVAINHSLDGREIEHMRTLFNLGGLDSLAKFAKELVQKWGSDFLKPERDEDETDKRYENRVARYASEHYHRVVRKVQGMVSQATMGQSAMLRSEGGTFKQGEHITPAGRPIVPNGKEDWERPVGEYKAPNEG